MRPRISRDITFSRSASSARSSKSPSPGNPANRTSGPPLPPTPPLLAEDREASLVHRAAGGVHSRARATQNANRAAFVARIVKEDFVPRCATLPSSGSPSPPPSRQPFPGEGEKVSRFSLPLFPSKIKIRETPKRAASGCLLQAPATAFDPCARLCKGDRQFP